MSVNPFANAINEAAEHIDHTIEQEFVSREIPEGLTAGRLIEYVELGTHTRETKHGKKTEKRVRLAFELLTPKNKYEIEVDGEKITKYDILRVEVPIKFSSRANFKKLFNSMRYGREEITMMAQMLGEAFVLVVYHGKSDDGKRTYANLFQNAACDIRAPFKEDPLSGEREAIKIPEATAQYRCMIWDNPTQEMWDSLFIEGSRTVKDKDGKEVERSNNFLQERILQADDFEGSAIQSLLQGLPDLPTTEEGAKALEGAAQPAADAPAAQPDTAPAKAADAPAKAPKSASGTNTKAAGKQAVKSDLDARAEAAVQATAQPEKKADTVPEVDPLDELGL